MIHYVQIDTPYTVWYDDLAWLLERCDSVLPDRVCVCLTFEDAVELQVALGGRELTSTILDKKPLAPPLPECVRMILACWYRDQREEARCQGYS